MLHTPHLRVTAYAGPNRAVALPAAALARDWDVVVTTYGVLQAEHSARQKELLAELEMTEEEVEAFLASSSASSSSSSSSAAGAEDERGAEQQQPAPKRGKGSGGKKTTMTKWTNRGLFAVAEGTAGGGLGTDPHGEGRAGSGWGRIVLDEAHEIRNSKTARFKVNKTWPLSL